MSDEQVEAADLARTSSGMSVTALVCGIVGVVTGLVPFLFFIAWVLGVLAIVFGMIARSRAKRAGTKSRQAAAGLILGLLAIAAGVGGLVFLSNTLNHKTNCYEKGSAASRATLRGLARAEVQCDECGGQLDRNGNCTVTGGTVATIP